VVVAVTERGQLLRLNCPECGRPREGGPEALVYLCRNCRRATVMGPDPKDYPLLYAEAKAEFPGRRVYVPFWLLDGEASWESLDPRKARVFANARRLGALAFPAFWSPRAAYHDNLTLRYALEPEPFRFEPCDAPVLDGVRAPEVLPELARLTWLGYLDRLADVTGLELRFRPSGLRYVAVPFFEADDKLLDGILGIVFPLAMFPSL
jgi:hypothetical protein